MRRSRLIAFAVLALLGAPVALHVVFHDLPAQHHEEHAEDGGIEHGHADHEHPVVGSAPAASPRLVRTILPTGDAAPPSTTWVRAVKAERNVLSFGALRTDDDVGLQPLLSTFLI
ncbi:MAG: hypothetical protein ACXW5U_10830 [Thermoanaerobaculia bacterium]